MFKALFIGYLFDIRSERALMREIEVNVAYRWFLGLGLTDKTPESGRKAPSLDFSPSPRLRRASRVSGRGALRPATLAAYVKNLAVYVKKSRHNGDNSLIVPTNYPNNFEKRGKKMNTLFKIAAAATVGVALTSAACAQDARIAETEAFRDCITAEFTAAYPAMLDSGLAFLQSETDSASKTNADVIRHLDEAFSGTILDTCKNQTGASTETVEHERQILDQLFQALTL